MTSVELLKVGSVIMIHGLYAVFTVVWFMVITILPDWKRVLVVCLGRERDCHIYVHTKVCCSFPVVEECSDVLRQSWFVMLPVFPTGAEDDNRQN